MQTQLTSSERQPACATRGQRLRAVWLRMDRHSLLSLLDQAVVSGTNFATSVMLKRCGSTKDELGLYTLAFSLVLLTVSLMDALVTMPYTIFAPRMKRRERQKYAGSVTVLYLLLGGLAMIGLMLGAIATGLGWGPAELSPVLWTMSGVISLLLLREFARRMSLAHLELPVAVAVDCGSSAVQMLGILLLAWYGTLNAVTALLVMGAGGAVVGLAWLYHSRRAAAFCRISIRHSLVRGWNFGRWVLASHVTSVVLLYAMPWLLVLFARDKEAASALAACATVLQLSNPFVIGLGNVLAPRSARAFAAGGQRELNPVVIKNLKLMGVSTLLFCGAVAIGGSLALRVLFGADMVAHNAALQVMTLGLLFTVLGSVLDQGLRAMGRPDAAFLSNFVALIAALVAAALMMPRWHVFGAACSVLSGNVAGASFRCWAYIRLSREGLAGACATAAQASFATPAQTAVATESI